MLNLNLFKCKCQKKKLSSINDKYMYYAANHSMLKLYRYENNKQPSKTKKIMLKRSDRLPRN